MAADNQQAQRNRDDQEALISRRKFLSRLAMGLTGIAAALIGAPIIGFLISTVVRREPEVWREVGAVDDFPEGATILVTFLDPDPLPWAGFAAQSAAFVRREAGEFVCFSIYCTHVGCPVRWEEGAQLFMCPCHGGVFHRDGRVSVGPPTRRLDQYQVRVREGIVEIRTFPVPAAI